MNNDNLILKIPCYGKTSLHTMTLYVYKTHLTMLKDNGSLVFNVNICDIACAKKSKNPILINRMILEMKDGKIIKFSLDGRYDLSGRYHRHNNTEILQLCKTFPAYINKLIAESSQK